ncbi:hypothetical protein HDF23_002444 [Mucilaginibacter lappiensis]|uniref:SprT-like family protein n=1 Tax=Mucilaginibacter lappiensis TaxID=354630 RepID=A0ABR6PL08_9SPHI|nr:hypothetical protein [Mucilaginibacter lappiensis]MBB6109695.1 hypothetical protein [Mucilaginibacter lappiensis]
MTTGRSSNNTYSRSSFILINNGGGYDAYVMTLIADSAYLKNDRSKLDRNKYNKRDADYSGLVLYFTPNGKYIGGWRYKNGHIVTPGNPGSSSGVKVQSLGTSKLKPMSEECYDYWLTSAPDVMIYLFTMCSGGDGGASGSGPGGGPGSIGGGGDGGGGSSGPSDGGPSTTTPPPPCNDAVHPGPVPIINSSGKLTVNDVPPDGGDGFPPPQGPCYVETPTPKIIDSLSKKYPCAGALISSLPNMQSDIAKLIYQAFGSKNGDDIVFLEGDKAYFATHTKEDGYTEYDNGVGKIYINPDVLANASNEYRLVTLYHEALHAYLDLQLLNLGEDGFKTKYPAINIVQRPNFSGNVKNQYDYYFDQGTTMAQVDPKHRTMADYFTDELRDAILAYNPNFPVDRATGLARGGIFLNDTSNQYFNTSEKDVTKGNSVGTKCTP